MAERIERTHNRGALAWLDLEMTGLDPQVDVIIQAAVIITDRDLKPLEQLVVDIWQPEAELEKMSPFVRKMHETTGLTQRVRKSDVDVRQAERMLMERVAGWCPYPATLCGNTIGQDRKFIDRYMPGFAGYLHYRMLDVTALKLVAQQFYPSSAQFQKSDVGAHDALVDINNSIAELEHYRKTILK